jgi:peptide/nickel transport system ATP-binding protein/oligopeptide transport system ATP-binding protein
LSAAASAPAHIAGEAVLRIDGLRTELRSKAGAIRAVDDVSFEVAPRETLGLVGESGCGKSMTALSIMRLLPEPAGRIVSGRIELAGVGDLVTLSSREMRAVRGRLVSMIFQEPMTSLNPVFTIGRQLTEAIRAHEDVALRAARERAIAMLDRVGIPSPAQRVDSYPHQLSGGMRQRVMIAMALACRPTLMLADEPTTALDVTIQAQILALMNRLKAEAGTSIILITHDLGVIARMAQRVAVMYAGAIVETADVASLFARPLHPYTQGLLASLPREGARRKSRLPMIAGSVPSLARLPSGCRFSDRCASVHEACRRAEPPLAAPPGASPGPARAVRCWLHVTPIA